MLRDDSAGFGQSSTPSDEWGQRIRQIADVLATPVEAFFRPDMYPLHHASNGDAWFLTRTTAGKVVVRHMGNPPSGGHASEFDVSAFLERDRGSPQHTALMQLVDGLLGDCLLNLRRGHARDLAGQ